MTAIARPFAPARPRPTVRRRVAALVDRWGLPAYTIAAVAYLLMPIAVMILFSFNEQVGKFNYQWHAFSLDAWANPFGRPGMAAAIRTSLEIAFLSTLAATALGTLIAVSLTRYRFPGRSATNLFIFLPMATPEIVMGASLLTLFVNTAQPPLDTVIPKGVLFPLGFNTILIAHIMFNISYVVVTVKARMAGFDRRLEEAAMDLGANEWATFWKVTFPLIFPGILAAALLAFSLSIDDFVVTNFTSGLTNTFPIWVWGSLRNSLPVQINVVGTMIFGTAVLLVVGSTLLQRRAQ
jgi:spermidine/putrescine transport system permease protein